MSSDTHHVKHPDIVDYKPVVMSNGKYKNQDVFLNNRSGDSITYSAAATQLLEIIIPAKTPINPARGRFDFQDEIPLQTARYSWTFEDVVPFADSIQVGTASD